MNESADIRSPVAEEIDLVDILTIAAKRKRLILASTLGAALLVGGITALMPNVYTGVTVILPPEEDKTGAASMLSSLLGAAGPAQGLGSAFGIRNPNDLYVGLLKSRTVADRLIDRFKLSELYDEDTLVDTRKTLSENTSITAGPDGLIKIEVEDHDAVRAAAIANGYIEELERLTESVAVSDAARRRAYFEVKYKEARQSLTRADIALKEVQQKTGLIKPDAQTSALFEANAILRAQIAAKEIELSSIGTFATDRNPISTRVRQELGGLKQQLSTLERNSKAGDGNILVPTVQIPEAGLEFLQRWRDVKYFESVSEFLAKQLEAARIDEGKNATLIQSVDRAIAPDKKTKPKRILLASLAAIVGAMVALAWALACEIVNRAKFHERHAHKLEELAKSWKARF
jgi:tyrosine-protein kinase Etk/Wzc